MDTHELPRFVNAQLPWSGMPVRQYGGIYGFLSERLPSSVSEFLPISITLFVDSDVPEGALVDLLGGLPSQIEQEIRRRLTRMAAFVRLGFDEPMLYRFLTDRRDKQPWALYHSRAGGLGPVTRRTAADNNAIRGVLPCSSMRNHGVAWAMDGREMRVWLATAHREGHDWDFSSDIGHESAHAAFAQVPLFAQGVQQDADQACFAGLRSIEQLTPGHLARLSYCYSELVVVAVRGEQRDTPTGLPVAEHDDLFALLDLSERLLPGLGFAEARSACVRIGDSLDIIDRPEIYILTAPMIRILPRLTALARSFTPPSLEWFRAACVCK